MWSSMASVVQVSTGPMVRSDSWRDSARARIFSSRPAWQGEGSGEGQGGGGSNKGQSVKAQGLVLGAGVGRDAT